MYILCMYCQSGPFKASNPTFDCYSVYQNAILRVIALESEPEADGPCTRRGVELHVQVCPLVVLERME